MKLPQLTIRDLFISILLIAAGLGSLMTAFRFGAYSREVGHVFVPFMLLWVSCQMLGEGLGFPFGRARERAFWGLALITLFLAQVVP